MAPQDEELTLQEVADELQLHYMTVYRYVRLGYLPAHKRGGSWRVLRSDLESLEETPPAGASRGKPSTPWNDRLAQRLLAADQAGAWKVIEAAQASGMPIDGVYLNMIVPGLRHIGEQWRNGNVSIAQEHAATQVATRLVARVSAQIARRGVSKGTVVIGTPATELHSLPVMIAADLIRLGGFEVLDLGSNLPADAFAEIVSTQQRLVAVAISVTTPGQTDQIAETIAAIRDRVETPIFLGGAAVDGDQHARLLGADFGASSAREVIPRLLDLAG